MSEKKNIALVQGLIAEVSQSDLYPQLLSQLQKDLVRAGIRYTIDSKVTPNELFVALHVLILDRVQHAFNEYLNLLYAVDVSESKLQAFKSEKIEDIAVYASYLILNREWKKVELRNNL